METEKVAIKDKKIPLVYEETLPVQQRNFTDIFCCIAFVVLIVVGGYAMVYGLTYGQPNNLSAPYDSDGNRCHQDALRPYRYLFFSNIYGGMNATTCVERCPQSSLEQVSCYPNSQIKNCSSVITYETFMVGERFCVPNSGQAYNIVNLKLKAQEQKHISMMYSTPGLF